MAIIGKPIDRVDARLKVTGKAKYAAEFKPSRMAYAFPVRSTIAKGTITGFDTADAEKSPGVIAVITNENAPRLTKLDAKAVQETGGSLGEQLVSLQDNEVHYYGQYIATVVAETYEQARAAAYLVKPKYDKKDPVIDLKKELPNAKDPEKKEDEEPPQVKKGDTADIINASANKIDQLYRTPTENHHPMEPHATIALWEGSTKLTLYESTQAVVGAHSIMAYLFEMAPDNVQVISPFVGGGFGCKGGVWGHVVLAAMAAKVVNRPVKLAVTRQMMQTNVGRRGETLQTVALATDGSGILSALRHHTDTYGNLSDFYEQSGKQTKVLYKAPNREITYKVAKLNVGTPIYMRAPGETPGTFALESAIDEMAFSLNIDPIAFRTMNHTAEDPVEKHPFSSEHLLECYKTGAERFGWSKRKMQPGQTRNGNYLIGYGMATATYPANRSQASARIQMKPDGGVTVMSATQDIGTGTYTILAQTASEALGVPMKQITVKLGDSSLPPAPVSGGSQTTASVNPAVLAAAKMLRNDLLQLAINDPKSSLSGRKSEEISFANGKLFVKDNTSKGDSYADIMRRNNKSMMEACTTAKPVSGKGTKEAPCMTAQIPVDENTDKEKYSFHSFGAQFAEVWVDEDFGTVRVKRFVSVQDVGRIMNEKTARSQIIGGVIYGIGAALMEETIYDERWANPVTRSLADYHVPVNLDIPEIDVHFIGKPDPHISPIGARGIGEIGITGVAAAIANAIFNATGKRLRDLPFTPDKLI